MNATITTIIAELVETPTNTPNPLHEVRDAEKLAGLMDSMTASGWVGAPVVVDGDWAITGAHRIAAAMRLWNHERIDIPIPRVEISDLCAVYGLDWAAHVEDSGDWYEAIRTIAERLPAVVVEYLGLDAH